MKEKRLMIHQPTKNHKAKVVIVETKKSCNKEKTK